MSCHAISIQSRTGGQVSLVGDLDMSFASILTTSIAQCVAGEELDSKTGFAKTGKRHGTMSGSNSDKWEARLEFQGMGSCGLLPNYRATKSACSPELDMVSFWRAGEFPRRSARQLQDPS